MPDYSLCKVYKLISNQTDKVYIGSTCQELSQRLAEHRRHYKRYLNGKKTYFASFEILKYPDAKIILVQSYPDCKSNMEKLRYEQDWIDCYDCVNKISAYTSPEQKKLNDKAWRGNNKEEKAIKDKNRYEEKREQILEQRKDYYEEHKEQILEKQKEYDDARKEQRREKVICECGAELTRGCLSRHITTKTHQNYINNLS